MKSKRHMAILDMIKRNEVSNQETLLILLRDAGFDVTQATISRDIKTLDLVKTLDVNGHYRYVQRQYQPVPVAAINFKSVFVESVISVDYAINTVVIKCHVGMANAACAALDIMQLDDVVGTIAGDDTIFVLLRSERSAATFVERINKIIE